MHFSTTILMLVAVLFCSECNCTALSLYLPNQEVKGRAVSDSNLQMTLQHHVHPPHFCYQIPIDSQPSLLEYCHTYKSRTHLVAITVFVSIRSIEP